MGKVIAGVSKLLRIGLRSQISLFVLVLLSIPYMGYRFVEETRGFFRHSQVVAQEQIAQSVSNLFAGQHQLLKQIPELSQRQALLTKFQLDQQPKIDGNIQDWGATLNFASDYHASDHGQTLADPPSMTVVLAEYGPNLFGAIQVKDQHRVPHNKINNKNAYDHIELSYINKSQQRVALQLLVQDAGAMAVEISDDGATVSGAFFGPAVKAYLYDTATGYQVEFVLPSALLGPKQQIYLGLADADQNPQTDAIDLQRIILDGPEKGGFSALNTESNLAMRLLSGHANAGVEIALYDRQLNRLAKVGSSIAMHDQPWQWSIDGVFEGLVDLAFTQLLQLDDPHTKDPNRAQAALLNLAVSGVTVTNQWASQTSLPIQATAKPIFDSQGNVLGLVLVQQSTAQLLAWQRQAMQNIASLSLGSMLLILLLLFLVFWRLAYRIRRLGQEAKQLVDPQGRLQTDAIVHEINQTDELGDLARSLNQVVAQLHQHQAFLSQMPRTLSHEINNPLNAIATSLGNMAQVPLSDEVKAYLAMAQRGIHRIDGILSKLADAANLEQALTQDIKESFDVAHLVWSYCAYQDQIDGGLVDYKGPTKAVMINAVDYRIEQLLDKLLDNARDFRHPTTHTLVELRVSLGWIEIKVSNFGPPIDASYQRQLFNSMVSHRTKASPADESHFGLGLYVVRSIVRYHQGQIRHHNLANDSGVCFTIRLPALGLS
ncbi:MAG: ATP-binding protein [Oceanospirillaceae bacterium]|nr:ATP-binding protein [Oceanospirillaceae bacterium]